LFKSIGLYACHSREAFLNFTIKESHSYQYDMTKCQSPPGKIIFNAVYGSSAILGGLRETMSHAFLFNFGSHMQQQPSPFDNKFLPEVQNTVRVLAQLSVNVRTSFPVWYDLVVPPYDKGGFVTGYRDGRTVARGYLWNVLMRRRLIDGVLVVPLSAMSMPWIYNNPNNDGHYSPYVYMQVARCAASMICKKALH